MAKPPPSKVSQMPAGGRGHRGGRGNFYKSRYGRGGRGAAHDDSARDWAQLENHLNQINGSQYGGAFNIIAPGQEVLPRTSAMIDGNKWMELRFTVSLPAAGRKILGKTTWQILAVNPFELGRQSLMFSHLDQPRLHDHVASVERQHAMRARLPGLGLTSFIATGSILPRASGAAAVPMDTAAAVLLQSPKEAEVTMRLHGNLSVTGMGIRGGVTILTGGGFHRKSTLLEAIELGVYNHIPGDGRELIVTDPTVVKIRAEDGRSVNGTDISPFISNLPGGRDTKKFSTEDASGSTSMASNIQEAVEAGCKTLLIDEDSSAMNLLVRDQRMQKLIQKEPITPLISKVQALYTRNTVSVLSMSSADLVTGCYTRASMPLLLVSLASRSY